MSKGSNALIYFYAKKHWPSGLPKGLSARMKDIKGAAKKAIEDLSKGATKEGVVVRLAGQSGSGKTTQLLPAARAYFEKEKLKPILIAARELAKYHPYYEEILEKYGEKEIRKRTDDFATVMSYRVIRELTKKRYDLIIDIAFASTKVEHIFTLLTAKYKEKMVLLMAISDKISERLLRERNWRHDKGMEKEFQSSNEKALRHYGHMCPEMRIIMWGFDSLAPVYDGAMSGALRVWKAETQRTDFKDMRIKDLVEAKINYILKH